MQLKKYYEFLNTKQIRFHNKGIDVNLDELNVNLFDWQKNLVQWALKKGRSALFESCGLGKTLQLLSWATIVCEKTGGDVLTLAPLAVSTQTQREGYKFGINVNIAKDNDSLKSGINITNYEKMERFDPSLFAGIVLDESSILKSFTGKTTQYLIDAFRDTQYKLCCTATPSPNDFTELGNTAEFLGVMSRPEMLSMFFINDTAHCGTWRLKKHIAESKFWEWLSSWAMFIQKPSDLGFKNEGFDLPKLNTIKHILKYEGKKETLFTEEANTLTERRDARKESLPARLKKTIEIVNNDPNDIWLIWCNLNIEGEMIRNGIDNIVEVKGADKDGYKEKNIIAFAEGKTKRLVSKSSIMGFGINLQCCHNVIFFGLSDSYEQFYQSVRRCWRFGQKHEVDVHIVLGEREMAVLRNIERKEKDTQIMFDSMLKCMQINMLNELKGLDNKNIDYRPTVEMALPEWV